LRTWTQAIEDGSVRVYGEPELVRALPSWFMAIEPSSSPARLAATVQSVVA